MTNTIIFPTMLTYTFFIILAGHGLFHVIGFAKAFGYGNIPKLPNHISKQAGRFWLFASLLFIISATGFLLKKDWWPVMVLFALVVSQVLIILSWKDAKAGTLINLVILLVALSAWGGSHFESRFTRDVKMHLQETRNPQKDLLTEADLLSLPAPLRHYLHYCGAVGRPKMKNMRMAFEGELRGKEKDWFPFTSLQYNFFDEPARLFFIKGKMYGLTVPGYHDYQDGKARMNIKLLGMISVVHAEGTEMDRTETVTYFNDLCLFAPAALVDKSILWKPVDSSSVRATFTNGANTITAILFFNEKGQLVNFISDDRRPIDEIQTRRFSTPVKNYKPFDGRNIPTYGETIWHYPDGDFVYGRFYLKSIEYNVSAFKK